MMRFGNGFSFDYDTAFGYGVSRVFELKCSYTFYMGNGNGFGGSTLSFDDVFYDHGYGYGFGEGIGGGNSRHGFLKGLYKRDVNDVWRKR